MTEHVILDNRTHRDLRVDMSESAELGDSVMSALVVPIEFRQVQAHYPIVFRRDLESGAYSALALFGFEQGENLFLDSNGWDARYKPLSVAIRPFLVGLPEDGEGPGQVHIDLSHPRADTADGLRLFEDDGRPTAFLESIADKLGALDAGYRQSAAFYAALDAHQLLEPLAVDIPLNDGSEHRLVGFHAIDEDRLIGLDSAALGELHSSGHLMPLFMALASLSHFTDLVDRKNRRLGDG